jgi:hypothetical protein
MKLIIQPYFGDLKFKLNENYYQTAKNDSIQIETLKFYISGIEVLSSNKLGWKEKNSGVEVIQKLIECELENKYF